MMDLMQNSLFPVRPGAQDRVKDRERRRGNKDRKRGLVKRVAIANCYLMPEATLNGDTKVPQHKRRRGQRKIKMDATICDP